MPNSKWKFDSKETYDCLESNRSKSVLILCSQNTGLHRSNYTHKKHLSFVTSIDYSRRYDKITSLDQISAGRMAD